MLFVYNRNDLVNKHRVTTRYYFAISFKNKQKNLLKIFNTKIFRQNLDKRFAQLLLELLRKFFALILIDNYLI